MIILKNMGLAGIAALLAFATAANAQTDSMFMQSSNSVEAADPDGTPGNDDDVAAVSSAAMVASELFGSGAVKLEFGETGFAPEYNLTYVPAMDAGTPAEGNTPAVPPASVADESVQPDDIGMITYLLSGATFDERVSPNDFEITGSDSAARLKVTANGAKGDNSVTVEVTAGAAWVASDGDASDVKIKFTIPDLSAAPGRAAGAVNPVRMTSSYMLSTQSKFPEGSPKNMNCDDRTKSTPVRGCQIVTASPYIDTFSLSGAAKGNIDLANRAKLISGTTHLADIAIGTVKVMAVAGTAIKDQDGDPVNFAGDLSGDVAIKVASSQFRDGDIVYIDDNGDKKPTDSREMFAISDGMATADRALPVPGEGTPMATWTVRYMPNGEDALTHDTKLTVSAATDFTDRDNMNATAKMDTASAITSTLALNGIRGAPAKAYAVAPLDNTDTTNLRITCESGMECRAFLSCHDDMGTDYFGDAGIMIPANGSKRLDQTMINSELDMMEGESWSGRLSCEVLSTAPISVQVLTRADGVLVNNTYVGPGGM